MVVSAACQDAVAEFLLSCGSQEPPLALFTQSQGTPGLAPLLATDGPASYFHDSWYEAPCLASPANLHILERAGASKDVPPEEDESWLADYHGLTPEAKAAVAGRLEAAHKQLNAALVLHFKDLLQPALMDLEDADEMSEGGGGSRSLAALDFVAAELHAAWEANLSTWGPDSERVELCLQAYNAAVLARVQAADNSSGGASGRQQLLVPGFRQHVESLVGLLQCPGCQDAFSFMAECVCFTSKAVVPAALRVLLCLGGLAGGAAAEAHGREVVDVLVTTVAQQFERATQHGMEMCAALGCLIAARHPERARQQVVDMLSAVLHPKAVERCVPACRDEALWLRTNLVRGVMFLRTMEAVPATRKAFKAGKIDELLWGGYTVFLQRMGLKVDLENDSVAKRAVENPDFFYFDGQGREEIGETSRGKGQMLRAEAEEHNRGPAAGAAAPPSHVCAQCGVTSSKEAFKTCSRCRIVYYCSAECQKVHWKQGGHKKVCKSKHPPMVEKWAARCPKRMIPNGETASSWMAKMGITDELLAGSGLSVGDWPQLMQKISASTRTTRIRNNPPLREGDLVLIHPGNGLKVQAVGKMGILEQRFGPKWGLTILGCNEGSLILEDNLERCQGM